jgi:anti-anti-sigma factor
MASDARIEVTSSPVDGEVSMELTGELDQARADQLREALEQATGEPEVTVVRVDARGLTLLDSTSLGLLLYFARKLMDRGGFLELTYALPTVRRTLDAASLGRAMRLVQTAPGGPNDPGS